MTLSRRAFLELSLLGMIWGASFLAIRLALNEVSVLSSVVHRVGWAALVLWAVVVARGIPLPRDPRVWGAFAVMGLLNNVVPFTLMTWAQLHVETGLTSILNATTAIFGVIAAAVFFRDERLTWRRMIGVGLGFAGVATIVGLDALGSFDLRSLGQIAILAGTFSYALAGVWARKRLSHLPPMLAAAGMLSASLVIMMTATLLIEGDIDLPHTATGIGAIAYYTLIATAGAYLLYYRVLAMAGSGNLLLVTLIIPPIAIVLGAVVLGERLGPSAFVGLAMLAAGLLVLKQPASPRKTAAR